MDQLDCDTTAYVVDDERVEINQYDSNFEINVDDLEAAIVRLRKTTDESPKDEHVVVGSVLMGGDGDDDRCVLLSTSDVTAGEVDEAVGTYASANDAFLHTHLKSLEDVVEAFREYHESPDHAVVVATDGLGGVREFYADETFEIVESEESTGNPYKVIGANGPNSPFSRQETEDGRYYWYATDIEVSVE